MRRLWIFGVVSLLSSAAAVAVGAGSAWASRGASRTTIIGADRASTGYGQDIDFDVSFKDESSSCVSFSDCDEPTGLAELFDGTSATTPFAVASIPHSSDSIDESLGLTFVQMHFAGLVPGLHTVVATYVPGGSDPFDPSSGSKTVSVDREPTSLTLTQDSTSTTAGQNVEFTATLTPTEAPAVPDTTHGAQLPSGPIEIRETVGGSTVTYGSGLMDFTGKAVIDVTSLPIGSRTLFAHYTSDGNYESSDSATLAHSVAPGGTASVLGTSVAMTVFGQPVTLTDTVSPVSPATGTPTGTVAFNDLTVGGTVGSAGLSGANPDQAVLSTSSLAVGPHSIDASYPGDPNFAGSPSNTVSVTVAKADTTTGVTSSLSPSALGQPVTFTATVVVVSPGSGALSGTVQFTDDNVPVGPPMTLVGGVATLTVSSLPGGPQTIGAAYSGDGNHNGSTGTVLQTVTCDSVISGSQTSLTAGPGTTCLAGADVRNITVPAGAKLSLIDSTVHGTISSRSGAGPVIICGTHVGGNLKISGATGFLLIGDPVEDGCAANTIDGVVILSHNTGGLQLGFNHIHGRVLVSGNVGAGPAPNHSSPEVEANTIGGNLACTGNSPVASDDGRTNGVDGRKIGECSVPGF